MKLARLAAATLPFLFLAQAASAQISGPVFPPPGGVTFSTSGVPAGSPGGRNFHFSSFNPAAFGQLYWGANSGSLPTAALDGTPDPMSFAGGYGTPTAVWTGSTNYTHPVFGPMIAQTQLQVSLSSGSWIPSGSVVGLDPGPGSGIAAVFNTGGANFNANIQFLANVGAGMQPINTIAQQFSGLTQSSFAGGFYYTAAAIPEPETYAMLLAGLGLLGFALRRRVKPIA